MVSSGWKCISVLISIFQFLTHTTGNCLFKIFYPIVMSNVFMREKVFVCACKRETESSYGLSFVFLCVGIAWVKGGWQVFLTVEKKSQSDKWRLLDFQTLVESYDFFWKVDTNKGSPVVSCEVLETAIFSVNMRTAYISAYFFILFLFLFWGLKVLIQQPGQLGEACCDTWVVLNRPGWPPPSCTFSEIRRWLVDAPGDPVWWRKQPTRCRTARATLQPTQAMAGQSLTLTSSTRCGITTEMDSQADRCKWSIVCRGGQVKSDRKGQPICSPLTPPHPY